MKTKVIDFIMRTELWSRKEGSEVIRERFGDEGYRYYQDLWKRGCLGINVWGIIQFTKKGFIEEKKIKGWDS